MKYSLLTTGVGVLALGLPSLAQNSVETFERQLQQIQMQTRDRVNDKVPADQRALVDYGGYLSLNFLAIDDQQQNTHLLFQPDLVGYFRLNFDGVHEVFMRARASHREFYQSFSFDDSGDTSMAVVEQAYYRFHLGRYLAAQGKQTSNDLTVTGGRQFVMWANGLVLGQYLDGITSDITLGKVDLSLLAGVTVPHLTVDFDSSRRSFDDHTDRGFYGAMAAMQLGTHRPFVYGLIQQDYNNDDPMSIGSLTTNYKYNSWYIGAGMNGTVGDHLVYGLEMAYEGGHTESSPYTYSSVGLPQAVNQSKEEISAGALDLKLDYVVGDPHRSRLAFESILATGATDRVDSTSATFGGIAPGNTDHAFNALGLMNTGVAFAPQVSNIMIFRLGASTFPFASRSLSRLQVGTDLFFFGKFNSSAPLDEATTDDWYVGFEPDVYLNWQISSDLSFAMRYGVFFPGNAIVSDDNPRNFFFAGFTFSF